MASTSSPSPIIARPRLEIVSPAKRPAIEAVGGTVGASIIDSIDGLEAIEAEWRALFNISPTAAPPLDWSWVREWWRTFGTKDRRLHTVIVRRGRELVGVLPLYREYTPLGREHLFTISFSERPGDSFYPEYVDALAAPGTEGLCGEAIGEVLTRHGGPVIDTIRFSLASSNGVLDSRIVPALRPLFGIVERTLHTAPVADLSSGFDGYLTRLSARTRQQMRRLLRGFHETPEAVFEVASTSPARDEFFSELVALHQARWRAEGQSGAFDTPERIAFHRAVIARLGERAFLSRLRYKGATVTVLYGFIVGGKFDFYQSGNEIVERGLKRSGIIAHLLTMEALAARGIETYDFLAGEAPYKLQLATARRSLTELVVRRSTVRARIAHVLRAAAKGVRRQMSRSALER